MPNENEVYVYDSLGNRFIGMTKEEIVTAIQTGNVGDLDEGFISKILELNQSGTLQFWIGTMAEFEELAEKKNNVIYLLSDDPTVNDIEDSINAIEDRVDILETETDTAQSNIGTLQTKVNELEDDSDYFRYKLTEIDNKSLILTTVDLTASNYFQSGKLYFWNDRKNNFFFYKFIFYCPTGKVAGTININNLTFMIPVPNVNDMVFGYGTAFRTQSRTLEGLGLDYMYYDGENYCISFGKSYYNRWVIFEGSFKGVNQ